MRLWLASLAVLLAASGSALAQAGAAEAAARAAARLEAAAEGLAGADGVRDRVRALSETIGAFEEGLTALREALRRATLREAAIRERFDAEAQQLGRLIGVLQTIRDTPEATLLLHPDGALGTVRSGLLIADVAPAVAAEAEALRAALEELQGLRLLQLNAEATLREGRDGLQAARVELSQAMAERRDLPRRVIEDAVQMERLIAGSETLAAFATSLADLPPDPALPALPDFAEAQGDLALPVRGQLRHGYNEADAAGVRRPGWVLETAPAALVTAPWPATIRYAGPLLDYGIVMILEPSAGYLLVLAGLEQVYGRAGEIVPAGRPLGLMPGAAAGDAGGAPADADEPRRETLYIEIRQDGQPTDPEGWFRQDEDVRPR
jgi:septal ring factor EnvC (AmiA/AmiB activator)